MSEKRTFRDAGTGQQAGGDSKGTIHVGLSSTVVAFALARGMTPDEIRRETGFDVARLGDPEARPPDDVVHLLWNALCRAEPDKPIPLEAAMAAPFTTLGGLAHGMQFAVTLRDAVDFSKRNSGVLADRLNIRLIESAGEARVVATHPNDALDDGSTAEMGTCLIIRLLREVMGIADAVMRVDLSHAARGRPELYTKVLRCPVRFETGENAIVLHPAALDRPVRMGNPTMFAFIEQHFEIVRRQIQTFRSGDRLRSLQLAIYETAASGSYRTEDVLRRTGLRRRSAQRLAAAHGTTLAAQIEEARRSNAMAFLSDQSMSVEMAASLLGYSDDRAFRRAFKRWTGQSPSEFRKSRQQD